ncbi:uncharacterized protein N7482_003050 [Penicillium canariense]|uniref:Major facilitator superfamily (MFS) profile domain-containing protein n=1 Tax=Penicillium canariense TaxID=189055 RepID=A0A9W9IGB7_9EURO|nr:uncharacterized protein N7482_003050 [Penicillium canariense]KAJ5177173.1 hypothetical protein N7482_003050 [Penicillium canariense]
MPTTLVSRAGVQFKDLEYWNSALLISMAASALVCSPVFGYLVDLSGTRQGPYLFGLILLSASMAIFTVAHSVLWYTIARALQGAATAMVTVTGLAIVTDSVDKRNLGQMIGYIGTAMTLGFVSGPLLGGIVFKTGGFYAVFGMAFGILTLDFFLRLAVVEKQVAARWLNETERPLMAGSPVGGQAHYETELSRNATVKHPTSKGTFALFKLLGQPRILISLWAVIVSNIIVSAFDATLTIFVQKLFHWEVLGAGLIFLPGASAAVLQPFFGYLSDRLGSRIIAFTSFALLSPTLICLRFVNQDTTLHIAILCLILASVGMCVDLSEPAIMVEIQRALDDMEANEPGVFGDKGAIAQAFSLQSMAHFGGLAIGPMVGGFVSFHFGWNVMTLVLGLLALVTAVPMLWLSSVVEEGRNRDAERQPLLTT